jgi:hypothetical protein
MNLLKRYLEGETVEVYEEIYELEEKAFNSSIFIEVSQVLEETFKRVAYNLDVIYSELKKEDYLFVSNIEYSWQKPRNNPSPNVEKLLSEVRKKVGERQFLPLSLEYFYKIVGSCNFGWDYQTNPNIPWEGADPIEIPPIDVIIDLNFGDDEFEDNELMISPDYLHKDNISGSCYFLELTKKPSIDSNFDFWDLNFIEYLRLTFENCGFTRTSERSYENLNQFCERVQSLLKPI